MKKIISFVLVIAMLAGACVFLVSCADDPNTVIVCNWGEYISDYDDPDDSRIFNVIKKFEEETGIKVKYITCSTNEELYSTMKAGGVSYDVIFPSDYMVQKMIKENMVQKLNFDNIPNSKNVSGTEGELPSFANMYYDPENAYTVPYFWGTVGIIVNTKLYKGDWESLTWDDLWTDDYPNQVLMFNNPRDAFGVALNKLGYSMNTTDESEIRAAAAELKKMKFNYVMDEFFEIMPSEGAVLGVYYAGDYLDVASSNSDLEFVRPESGVNIFNDVMCVPSNARHKENAEKFINFMLREDVGISNALALGYSTPNTAVYSKLDEDVKNDEIAYPTSIPSSWERFVALPEATDKLIQDLWQEVLIANR